MKFQAKSTNPNSPEIMNIQNVLTFDKQYLSAAQPRPGFASPRITPPIRAAKIEKKLSAPMQLKTHVN